MFMNDVNKKEQIKNVAIKDLRELGIKYRPKKQRNLQNSTHGRRVFKTVLHLLPMETVTLTSGQQLIVPKVVNELCSFILTKVDTEGLFRKGGSKTRQNEMKLLLDSGCQLGIDHHEVDVANVLKTFFRELPEPLFPYSYHELFLHCALASQKLEALLLSCLLLPTEHLNTLAYFMQFLQQVTEHSPLNKMNSHNLAIVIGPTLFPIEEKVALNSTQRLTKFCELCKLLIENAPSIGFISNRIIDQIAPLSLSVDSLQSEDAGNKGKKKRRSGSLTRMFNGLRKIVSSKSIDTSKSSNPVLLQTPSIKKSDRKRKSDAQGFSAKKRNALLHNLPQETALSTPISINPNPKKNASPKSTKPTNTVKEKKSQWNIGKRNKNKESDTISSLETRWSAVSQATSGFKRNKMRNSCIASTSTSICNNKESEPDYVKISRLEYEEIQNRVSAIERCISLELDKVQNTDGIGNVQNAYEKTLVEAEHLSPTTDQLARRLSKELKIRQSVEQKIVRSPSARKIGSVRRRSHERHRVRRNQSLQLNRQPIVNLRRGQPNTLWTGLPRSTSLKSEIEAASTHSLVQQPQLVVVHAGIVDAPINLESQTSNASNNNLPQKWTSDDGYFTHSQTPNNSDNNLLQYKSSIVKLRNRNVGMVLAKARLFNQMIDSDNSNSNVGGTKIGATRNVSQRIRTLKSDEKHIGRQSISPRKKPARNSFPTETDEKENEGHSLGSVDMLTLSNSSDKGQVLKDYNRLISPNYALHRCMPQIKRSLSVKSPRHHRVPVTSENRQTPLKVLSSQRFY